MAASLTDNLLQVAVAGSETTLAAPGKAIGANSLNITSNAGWPTITAVIFALRRVDSNGNFVAGTYTEWIGTLSGTTLTINTSPLYGTDQTYAADGLTQVYIPLSASLWNRFMNALLVDHFQNGGHGTLHDSSGNAILDLIRTASAVNNLFVQNAATGGAVQAGAEGSDSNIDLLLLGKGTGSSRFAGYHDGWVLANETPTFASSTTINVAAGSKYQIGDILQFTQSSTVKYFVVTGISSNVLTVAGITGQTVANSAISNFYYSREKLPTGLGINGGHPFNPYKFSVYRNSALTDGNGALAVMTFDTKTFDTGSNVDVTTNKGRFTAPVAGFYYFISTITFTATGVQYAILAIYKNGSLLKGLSQYTIPTGSNNSIQSGGTLVQLAANDYIEIYHQGTGGSITVGAANSFFEGFLVSAL